MMPTPPMGQVLAYPDLLKSIPGFSGFLARQAHLLVFGSEAVLCRNHGARAVRLNRLLGGLPHMLLLIIVAFVLEGPRGFEMLAVTILVTVAFLHRNAEAWNTLRAGHEARHTWFMGDSVLVVLEPYLPEELHGLLHDHWLLYRIGHPALVIGLGVVAYATGGSLVVTCWLWGSGACMAAKNFTLHAALVDIALDQVDAGLARHHLPNLIKNAVAGPNIPHAGMPVSPEMMDILRTIPTPDMDDIVAAAMGNGAKPEWEQQELPDA